MVSGLSGVVSDVSVDLKDITAADFGGLDVLLVSPEGLNLTLVSDVGRGWSAEHLNLTLSDSASQPVAVSADPVSGNYLATNEGLTPDGYPPPAPPIREATSFAAAFANTKPNGSWSLYVVQDGDTIRNGPAVIQGGWNLRITTVTGPDVTTTSVRSLKNPSIAGVSVGYAVTVADLDGRAVTEGTVILTVDGNQVGFAGGLNGADVTFIVPPLDEGSHRVKATYQPASGLRASSGTMTQNVDAPTTRSGNTFCNSGPVSIPERGTASPYPSRVNVTGLAGSVSKVTLKLNGFSHTAPRDVDAMLVGPDGQSLMVLSDVRQGPVSDLDLLFDDAAEAEIADNGLASGTFKPTNHVQEPVELMPSPAPFPSGATTLATFNGHHGEGVWSLFVVDDDFEDEGKIGGGWCVTVQTETVNAVVHGPYLVTEGQALQLNATTSTAATGVSYGWDVNGDGDFSDAAGPSPRLSWARLQTLGIDNGPFTGPVRVRVSSAGLSAVAGTTLTVKNNPPTAVVTGPVRGTVDEPVTFTVGATDPSRADAAGRFTYRIDWGDGGPSTSVFDPARGTFAHIYRHTGTYSVQITATDRDGGRSAPRTVVLIVATTVADLAATGSPWRREAVLGMGLLLLGIGLRRSGGCRRKFDGGSP